MTAKVSTTTTYRGEPSSNPQSVVDYPAGKVALGLASVEVREAVPAPFTPTGPVVRSGFHPRGALQELAAAQAALAGHVSTAVAHIFPPLSRSLLAFSG